MVPHGAVGGWGHMGALGSTITPHVPRTDPALSVGPWMLWGWGSWGQHVPCPLYPTVTPGTGPFPTVAPAGHRGQWGHALPRPASPHQSETQEPLLLSQPIRARHTSSSQPIQGGGGAEGSMAASPPANGRPAVPTGEGEAGRHGGCGTAPLRRGWV